MLTFLLAACWSLPGSKDTVPAHLEVSSFSAALRTDPAAFPLQPSFKGLFGIAVMKPFPFPSCYPWPEWVLLCKTHFPSKIKKSWGQEATTCCFLLVSVLTPGFGQEHKKNTWHCSSRKEENVPVEDVCLLHLYIGLFERLGCKPRIDPLGRRDMVSVPTLEGFPAIQLSTQTGIRSAFEAGPCFEQEVGLETYRGPSLHKSCDWGRQCSVFTEYLLNTLIN